MSAMDVAEAERKRRMTYNEKTAGIRHAASIKTIRDALGQGFVK